MVKYKKKLKGVIMIKAAFVGFGEVNTPIDIIINKCKK